MLGREDVGRELRWVKRRVEGKRTEETQLTITGLGGRVERVSWEFVRNVERVLMSLTCEDFGRGIVVRDMSE